MEIKYEKEIKSLLKDIFHESWMDDEDWQELEKGLEAAVSIKEISDKIEVGISNGYSLDLQLDLCRALFVKMKDA